MNHFLIKLIILASLFTTGALEAFAQFSETDFPFSDRFICRLDPTADLPQLIKLVNGQETQADFKVESPKAAKALGAARKKLKNATKKSPNSAKFYTAKDRFRMAYAEKIGIKLCKNYQIPPAAPVVAGPKVIRAEIVAERRFIRANDLDLCVRATFVKFKDIKDVEWEKVSYEILLPNKAVEQNEIPAEPPFDDVYFESSFGQTYTVEEGYHRVLLGSSGSLATDPPCTIDEKELTSGYDNIFVHIK